jgi:adenosylcobinamide-GDP ribazoletransferase
VSGFRAAVSFLTRLPVGGGTDAGLARAAPWFPTVGGVVALTMAATYAVGYRALPSLLAALISVTVGILLTGAFHEDGLADSADALGSGAPAEAALVIMRDSRLGTFGTLAVVVSVLWRVLALGSLGPRWAVAALLMAHALGRAGAVVAMLVTPAARTDGLGRAGVLGVTRSGTVWAVGSALLYSGVAAGIWALPGAVVVAVAVLWFRRASIKRMGGVTGDLLGACEQVGEMGVLAVAAVASWGGSIPWWAG